MNKRTISALLLICLLMPVWCSAAHAEQQANVQKIFTEAFWEQFDLQTLDETSSYSFAVTGNSAYQLMSSGDIYAYDLETGEYALYAHVPALPKQAYSPGFKYSELDDETKALVDGAVFQLIGRIDGDELYGYCLTSGLIGRIDEEGIHWNEIRLDNSLQMKGNLPWPDSLLDARILGESLYAFYNKAENFDAPCDGVILKWNLVTGDCQITEVPGAYALCCTPSEHALLLCMDDEGMIVLRRYDLQTQAMNQSAESLPISQTQVEANDQYSVRTLFSGLAWHEDQGLIYFATPDGLWFCAADDENPSRIALNGNAWDGLNVTSEAWLSKDGSYVLFNGSKYVVTVD